MKTTTPCIIPRCRNVGRTEYRLLSQSGEFLCDVDSPYLICKKHLLEGITSYLEKKLEGHGTDADV